MFYRRNVKALIRAKRPIGYGKLAALWLMLFLWLGTFAITISPQLHSLLHADARSANHTCLITHLSKGALVLGAGPVRVEVPAVISHVLPGISGPQYFSPLDYRVSASRAPPSPSKLYRA
jgi:hypothetical protein